MKKVKNLRIFDFIKNLKNKKDQFHDEVECYDTSHRSFDKYTLTSADYGVQTRVKLLKRNNYKI